MPGDMDFAEVIEQAQASVMARAEREAAEAGVTVDELWERQRIADEAEARQQRHLAATEERAERIKAISPGLTAPVAQALCQGALTDDARFPAVRVVREWLANPNSPPIMFLAGGTGCGKTVAAAWALARMGGEYVRAVDLARRSEPYRGGRRTAAHGAPRAAGAGRPGHRRSARPRQAATCLPTRASCRRSTT